MSSHSCDTGKVAFERRWLLIGGTFVYNMSFWGMAKWPPMSYLALSALFEYLCYESTAIIIFKILSVREPSLDVRI